MIGVVLQKWMILIAWWRPFCLRMATGKGVLDLIGSRRESLTPPTEIQVVVVEMVVVTRNTSTWVEVVTAVGASC